MGKELEHAMKQMNNSQTILYKVSGNDEAYTPAYAVTPILKYIPKSSVVWCPFDTLESEFVKQIINFEGGGDYK